MGVRTIIGIDPGNNGAIVVLERGRGATWGLKRVFRLSSGERPIATFLQTHTGPHLLDGQVICYLEKVHGWGEARSFNFGMFYGFVRGVLYACGLGSEAGTIVDVTPQRWMKEMGVPPQKGQKAQHRQAMRALAEGLQNEVSATNWNAAAILISLYGLKQEGGQLG